MKDVCKHAFRIELAMKDVCKHAFRTELAMKNVNFARFCYFTVARLHADAATNSCNCTRSVEACIL